jgi:glucose-1-phosphate cytidylyltransferase
MADDQLLAQRYDGFWSPMDTLKDQQWLENLHESGQAPWQLWNSEPSDRVDAVTASA